MSERRGDRRKAAPRAPPQDRPADAVLRQISQVADPDGFVPFDRFMEVALYGEGVGFYARKASPFGPEGDYYTAAHVTPLFARTLAERIRTVRTSLGGERPFRVVEVGSGDGTLAEGILQSFASRSDASGFEYALVERSEALRELSRERIEAAGRRGAVPVRWMSSVGADGPFAGYLLANELLDAEPARRLRWDGGAWRELGVRLADGRLVPAEQALLSPVPGPSLPTGLEPGAVLEVSPGAEAFVREVSDHLSRGAFLVLDFGMEERELLAAHPSGTLAVVRRHRSEADPLADPGTADLSTFVNFTRLRSVAEKAGLRELTYSSQAEALGAWGFPALLESAVRAAESSEAEVRTRLAAKNLVFGFERFRALEWAAPSSEAALRRVT